MIRGGTLVLVAALLLAGVPAGGVAPAGADTGGEFVPGTQVEADRISMRADVAANGTATWEVAYRIRLATENETAAFEDLREDIERNTSEYVDEFAAGINATVASAENRTGREMGTGKFGVETSVEQVPREYGVVKYRFRWDGFAAVEGKRIVAGDALSGLFLDESTRLTVAGPPGYAPSEVSPAEPATVGDNSVSWGGPLEFGSGEPTLVFSPATTTSAGDGGTLGGGNSTLLILLAAALVAATVAATVAVVVYRRSESSGWPIGAPAGESGGDEAGADDGDGAGGGEGEDGSDGGASSGAARAGAEAGAGAAAGAEDEALLSNEERVLRLLSERGGRAKQQEVVAALDWTEAKTSQVVNDMHESGRIEKFRIGRENVLKLPDEDAESE